MSNTDNVEYVFDLKKSDSDVPKIVGSDMSDICSTTSTNSEKKDDFNSLLTQYVLCSLRAIF